MPWCSRMRRRSVSVFGLPMPSDVRSCVNRFGPLRRSRMISTDHLPSSTSSARSIGQSAVGRASSIGSVEDTASPAGYQYPKGTIRSDMTKTIAVHGATGSQGEPVAAAFVTAGHVVRPVTRASGGDLLDRASWELAYAGVDAVVLTFPVVYDERVLVMAGNAARAAEAAGVRQ